MQETMTRSKGNNGGTSVLSVTRDIDGNADDDATVMSETPLPCFDPDEVASAQEQESLPRQTKKRQQHR